MSMSSSQHFRCLLRRFRTRHSLTPALPAHLSLLSEFPEPPQYPSLNRVSPQRADTRMRARLASRYLEGYNSRARQSQSHSVAEKGMTRRFTVVIEREEDGTLVGTVPGLHGCHTQARSLDELLERVREAIELCLEVQGDESVSTLELVGFQSVAV